VLRLAALRSAELLALLALHHQEILNRS
jgi:hypothetical protein